MSYNAHLYLAMEKWDSIHLSGCNTNTGLVMSQVCINPQHLLTHQWATQQKHWTLLILLIMLFLWVNPNR